MKKCQVEKELMVQLKRKCCVAIMTLSRMKRKTKRKEVQLEPAHLKRKLTVVYCKLHSCLDFAILLQTSFICPFSSI